MLSVVHSITCAHEHKTLLLSFCFCWLTSEDAQDSSNDGDLGLGLVGGWANLDALQSEQRHDHGAEAEQQSNDHQSATRLQVSCREGKMFLHLHHEHHEQFQQDIYSRDISAEFLLFCSWKNILSNTCLLSTEARDDVKQQGWWEMRSYCGKH